MERPSGARSVIDTRPAFGGSRFLSLEVLAMDDYVPMTREGFNKLKADVERMEGIEMPAIAEKIGAARAEGDLKENAEYHAQREAQGMLQARINVLKTKLA